MALSCSILILVSTLLASQIFCEEFGGRERILRRKRRYVTFPEGSSLGVQSVLSKPLLDYSFPSDWNWNVEYTVSFKLPNDTLQRLERLLQSQRDYLHAHRRERRHVFQQLEAILNLHGMDGKSCLLRTICESKFLLSPGRSLWQDMLHVIFRMPEGRDEVLAPGGYDEAASHQDCEPWATSCPVSFLGVLLASATSQPGMGALLPFLGL